MQSTGKEMMNPGSESKPGGMGVFKYDLLLLFTSIIWGAAFVAQQIAMERGLGPMRFNGLRFALKGLVKGPAFSSRLMAVVVAATVPPCPPNRDSLTRGEVGAIIPWWRGGGGYSHEHQSCPQPRHIIAAHNIGLAGRGG